MPIRTTVVSLGIFATLVMACGNTMMRVDSSMDALTTGMTNAGCVEKYGGWECPDGSSYVISGQGIMCKGSASGDSACAAEIRRFGGKPGRPL